MSVLDDLREAFLHDDLARVAELEPLAADAASEDWRAGLRFLHFLDDLGVPPELHPFRVLDLIQARRAESERH